MPGSILKAIFPVIAYLCIGYIAKRTKKFDPNNSGILIGYVLNISIPCMIVLDMTRQDMFKDLSKYIYHPTQSLVEFTKSLNVPVICFPRGIKNYKTYCDIVQPDAICIDYEVDPLQIKKEIKIPVQGGMDPKILLTDKENLKKEAKRYLDIFKDHPYIFNLGHGVLPETNPNMMDYLVKTVKDY